MTKQAPPVLSLVVPTLGKPNGLFRLLGTVIHGAPSSLLAVTELVVFLNQDPLLNIDSGAIGHELEALGSHFHSLRFIKSREYHLTAEESAYAASEFATGEYLMLAGDKRIFLPEGLVQLARYIEAPRTPCAYFNSFWQARDGHTNLHASSYFSASMSTMTYKQFVQSNGLNFMATNFGAWVFKRTYLDRTIWKQVIATCAPHFSHVVTLLQTMGNTEITCYSIFLMIAEAKAYHQGATSEWAEYAKRVAVYRYFIWTLGLVREFQHLVDKGVYTYADIRRSMCSEGLHLGRQINEIYTHFILQIRQGWLFPEERLTPEECGELLAFLSRVCPDRAIVHGMLGELYAKSATDHRRQFILLLNSLKHTIALDQKALPLSSLIVGQVGNRHIRLHPRGYLLSNVSDNKEFLLAYKLSDPQPQNRHWTIIAEAALSTLEFTAYNLTADTLFPSKVDQPIGRMDRVKRRIKSLCRRLYHLFGLAQFILMLPKQLKLRVLARLS
jgi:hypothetical protein